MSLIWTNFHLNQQRLNITSRGPTAAFFQGNRSWMSETFKFLCHAESSLGHLFICEASMVTVFNILFSGLWYTVFTHSFCSWHPFQLLYHNFSSLTIALSSPKLHIFIQQTLKFNTNKSWTQHPSPKTVFLTSCSLYLMTGSHFCFRNHTGETRGQNQQIEMLLSCTGIINSK